MKCLLITNIFPPAIGGPATFIDLLAHKLVEQGHQPSVVCSCEGQVPTTSRPFRVTRVDLSRRYSYEVKMRLTLLREITSHSRILVNGLEGYAFPILRLLGRHPLLKIVGDSVWERARNLGLTNLDIDQFQHSDVSNEPYLAPIARARRAQLAAAWKIVTPSEYLKGLVVGWGVNQDKVVVINNAVEAPTKESSIAIPQKSTSIRAIFVGRLTNWKGLETVLLALVNSPNVELVVCGDGSELPLMSGLARQLKVSERVKFLGRVSHPDVLAWLKSSDVAVLPSLYEGLSHTLLDALAHGLPVIASRCGGNPELVRDGISGFLVPPQNPAAICDALNTLRDNQTLRVSMGQAARAVSSNYSLHKMVTAYADLLAT
ncbi:MAG: glycosyltransferase family 4 protein [Oligoflexia bacterium]|nr:glycosyltransferase family 4 protein [Oligoflexia bacterium]